MFILLSSDDNGDKFVFKLNFIAKPESYNILYIMNSDLSLCTGLSRGAKCHCLWYGQRNTEQAQLVSHEGTPYCKPGIALHGIIGNGRRVLISFLLKYVMKTVI